MPRQNRVTPEGDVVASPARGLFMGNRGILHDAAGQLGRARWRNRVWICCQLSFRGRHRPVMAPGAYTELFFLDEAVALAAGHRPCAECRREDFIRFRKAFGGDMKAAQIDAALHAARAVPRAFRQRRHHADATALPDGTFLLHPDDGVACLVLGDAVLPFSQAGYGAGRARPEGRVVVLTPEPTIRALAGGYRPVLHPSSGALPGKGGRERPATA